MKKILSIIALTLMLAGLSCKKDFDSLEKDPNRPTSVPANLILNGVLSDLTERPFGPTQRWSQFYACNYAYYGDQQYTWTGVSFGTYNTLKNVLKMEEEAAKNFPAVNPYSALAKFFKAYMFYNLTMKTGDIPVSEALKSLENIAPKYDSQKEVFVQVLNWLDEANKEMGSIVTKGGYLLANDFYYNNNLAKWRKAVNSFKLRVLVQLSKQSSDADLKIPQQFAAVFSDPATYPVFESAADEMSFVWNNQYNKFPTNPESFGFDAARYNMTSTYLDKLVSLQDPRTFFVAEPAAALVAAGKAPTSFEAFRGAGSGDDLANMSAEAGTGKFSFINRKRYYSTYTAESTIQVGYAELCFNIAEAINRGWITGSAEDFYKKGIQTSQSFYGIVEGTNAVNFQKPGGTLSDYNTYSIQFKFADYYNQEGVKYAGNTPAGLTQILTQKYLAFYQNSGWEAYYNWRRTGVPVFHTGPGTGNSQRVALRFQYPVSEITSNTEHVKSAIQAQFAGPDDINGAMWIVK
ncbi:MAG: SusD/RagB family nutrient-binding outer membrane lipoprotein [Bacteroidota bacterium]